MQLTINVQSYRFIAIVFFIIAFAEISFGQHQGHQMPTSKPSPTPAATPVPSPSGTPHRHTPGMPMPAASPSPESNMNMPMPMPFCLVVLNGRKSECRTKSGVIPQPLSATARTAQPLRRRVSTRIDSRGCFRGAGGGGVHRRWLGRVPPCSA